VAHERIIFARTKANGTAFASASDFVAGRARPVSLRSAFLDSPESVSPYSLDVDRETVTFVRTRSGVDLAEVHPFFYAAQRKHAQSTITASFEEVCALSDDLAGLSIRFAFLYSAGRSGSTIAGRIASALPGVQSLSEPDIYAHATMQRLPGDMRRDAALVGILRATTRILAANRAAVAPDARMVLIKQRGLGIYGAPLVSAAVPGCRSIYLERAPSAVVDSYLGAFLGSPLMRLARRLRLDRLGVAVLRRVVATTHPWIAHHMADVIADSAGDGAAELLARSVASMNGAAARFGASGLVRFNAVLQYDDLSSSPAEFALSLARGLGLARDRALAEALTTVADVVANDAQDGSAVASKKVRSLSNDDARRLDRLVGNRRAPSENSVEVVV